MIKIWRVYFGENWCSTEVVARNYKEAVLKARKRKSYILKRESWVRKVELVCEAD
jgi:hypothetical protein